MLKATGAASPSATHRLGSACDDARTWADLIFPFKLKNEERLLLQPYWKDEWPNPRPAGPSDWLARPYRNIDDLLEGIRTTGRRLNVGVPFAAFVPTHDAYRRRKGGFSRSAALGVDMDCSPGKRFTTVEEALAWLAEFESLTRLKPGVIVLTGGGVHVYFLLDRPCSDSGPFERMLARLVAAVGGDEAAKGCNRMLRPPATRNFKYRPARTVRLLEANGQRYSWEALDTALPELPTPPAVDTKATSVLPRLTQSRGKVIKSVPPGVARLLAGAMPTRYGGDESRRDFFVACALAEQGASREDILATLRSSELGRQTSRKPNPDYYLEITVDNAIRNVRPKAIRSRVPARRRRNAAQHPTAVKRGRGE